jgi:hypothetical protein
MAFVVFGRGVGLCVVFVVFCCIAGGRGNPLRGKACLLFLMLLVEPLNL